MLKSSTPEMSKPLTLRPTSSVPQKPVWVFPAVHTGWRRSTVVELASTV